MPRGENLHSLLRTGRKRYTSRPSANCIAARGAWDHFAKDGAIAWIRLLDGYWGCMRPDGDIEEVENTFREWHHGS